MIRSVIIDDENNAIISLEHILRNYCSEISVVGTSTSPKIGIQLIKELNPDIVFLDIEMPEINGFNILRAIPERNFEVIFVTAYDQYAIEAFKVYAFSYLLKPLNMEDIVNVVERVKRKKQIVHDNSNSERIEDFLKQYYQPKKVKLAVPSVQGIDFIHIQKIICLEADRAYTNVILDKKEICCTKSLKSLSEKLDEDCFFRTHNSYIVNLNHVVKYISKEGIVRMTNDINVPVSRRNKDAFLDAISDLVVKFQP